MNNPCQRCGFEDHEENAKYCQNCGLELNGNYCTNSECELNTEISVPCAEDACYCPNCGTGTTFFKEGIIKPYQLKE